MTKRTKSSLEALANSTLSRLINKIVWGRKYPRDYGTGEPLFATEIEVVNQVALQDGITMTQLAEQLGVSKPAVSQVVNKLERKGYLLRKPSALHGSIRHISATPKGVIASRGLQRYQTQLHGHIAGITMVELTAYIKVLDRLEDFVDDLNDQTRHSMAEGRAPSLEDD